MKRDFDLIREILLKVENCENIDGDYAPQIDGYDDVTIQYHLNLLFQAQMVTGVPVKTMSDYPRLRRVNLTWEGHDFIDSIRNDSVWKSVKEKLKTVGGSAGLEVIKQVATQIAIGMLV